MPLPLLAVGPVRFPAYEAVTAMTDSDVKAPKIEFPCKDYPIKVIGDTGVGFKDEVIAIVTKHATINDEKVAERQSSNGKYTTLQLHIVATGQDQLYDINSELRATGKVHMVL
jgi:putative lipoic acid-binding regulatory protein